MKRIEEKQTQRKLHTHVPAGRRTNAWWVVGILTVVSWMIMSFTYQQDHLTASAAEESRELSPEVVPGFISSPATIVSSMEWVLLPAGTSNGSCNSATDCCLDIICFGLEYTPGVSGTVTTYTSGFFTDCVGGNSPILSNISCVMTDHSGEIDGCALADSVLFNSSGYDGALAVTEGIPVILHQVCFSMDAGDTIHVYEDLITDLSLSLDLTGGGHITEFPEYNTAVLIKYPPVIPPDGVDTVACVNDINLGLVTPPVVSDFCGNLILPVGPAGPAFDPPGFTCEGTVTYTWVYTDCDGVTAEWQFVFTIDRMGFPFEIGGPATTDSLVECGYDANPPVELPSVVDACGNILTPAEPVTGGTWTGGCEGTVTYTYTYTDCVGTPFDWIFTYTIECEPFNLHVWLEGSYDALGDSMRTEINFHHLLPGQDKLLSPSLAVQLGAAFTPFGQPYAAPPWNYVGNTGMNFGDPSAPGAPMGVLPYPADVVDWILVSIRENGILPVNSIWSCAGWVHSDGRVSFPEACGPLSPDPMDDYYVMLQHRNHLGILSADPVDMMCGGAILEWDFTVVNSYEPPFRAGQKELESGVWGMFAANGEQIFSIAGINSQDLTLWRTLQNIIGYSPADYNLDVTANSQDETIWKFNQNLTSGVIFY